MNNNKAKKILIFISIVVVGLIAINSVPAVMAAGGGGGGGVGGGSAPPDAAVDEMNGIIRFLLKLILIASAGLVPIMLGDKLAKAISGKIQDLSANAKKSAYARSRWGSDRAVKRKAAENLAQGRAWGRMQKGAQTQANLMQKMGLDKTGWGRKAIGNAQMRAGIAGTAAEKMNEEAYSKMHGAAAKRLADAEMKKPAALRDLNKIEAGARRLIELDEITGEDLGKYAQALAGADGIDATNRAFSLIQGAEKRRPGVANHHQVAAVLDNSMLDPRASHDVDRVADLEKKITPQMAASDPATFGGMVGMSKHQALQSLHPQVSAAYNSWKTLEKSGAPRAQVTAAKQRYEQLNARAELIRNTDGARGAFTAMGRAFRINEEKAVSSYQDQFGQGEEAWTKDQKGVIRISTAAASQMNTLQLQQAFNGAKEKRPGEIPAEFNAYDAARRVLVHGGTIEQARQEALDVNRRAVASGRIEYNNFGAWNEGTQVAFVQALSQQLGVEIRPDQRGGNPPGGNPPGGGGGGNQPGGGGNVVNFPPGGRGGQGQGGGNQAA